MAGPIAAIAERGYVRSVAARALVNASGPWIGQVQSETLGIRDAAPVRLIKGSHIVVRKLYPGEQAYVLQNADRRIVFVIPYQDDFTLIGTTDVEWRGAPATVSISAEETDYLCQTVNAYFKSSIAPTTWCGATPASARFAMTAMPPLRP